MDQGFRILGIRTGHLTSIMVGIVLAAGCGSSTSTTSSSATCPTNPSDSSCDRCLKGSCCGELNTCDNNPSCQNLQSCEVNCTTPACITSCEKSYSSGLSALNNFTSCTEQNCADQCNFGLGGSSSVGGGPSMGGNPSTGGSSAGGGVPATGGMTSPAVATGGASSTGGLAFDGRSNT